jgi:hypothetical protein
MPLPVDELALFDVEPEDEVEPELELEELEEDVEPDVVAEEVEPDVAPVVDAADVLPPLLDVGEPEVVDVGAPPAPPPPCVPASSPQPAANERRPTSPTPKARPIMTRAYANSTASKMGNLPGERPQMHWLAALQLLGHSTQIAQLSMPR